MKYELIIFDLDGTLMDTTEGIIESVKDTVKEYGLAMPSDKELRSYIGPPIQNSFSRSYNLDMEQAQRMADTFRSFYSSKHLIKASPYPGIFDLLSSLKVQGYKLAVATYKREDYALKLLRHYGFDQYISIMHGADNFNSLTKSDIIKVCIDEAGCSNDYASIVMVGDTLHDALGASNIGVKFLGVTFGFGFEKGMSYGVDAIGFADTPMEIMKFL